MINSILVIIGTIIGAGFASGKEIFTFFNVYGLYGFWGIIIAQFIMCIVLYKSFKIIIKNNILSYSQFVDNIIHKSKFINSIFCNIVNIFLLISFIVMVAGFAAFFVQEFNIPYFLGAIVICMLSFLTFLKNIDGIVKVNLFIIPFLIIIILLIGFKNPACFTFSKFNNIDFNFNFKFFISSLLYSSYNLIIVLPILITLKKYIFNIKQVIIVSCSVSFFLLLMSIILFFLLNSYYEKIKNLELPIIYIASHLGNVYKYLCGFTILGAVFTTAISSGYGFLNNLNISNQKLFIFLCFIICFIAIILSNIGFGTLLNLLYPILGLLRFITNYIYIIFY